MTADSLGLEPETHFPPTFLEVGKGPPLAFLFSAMDIGSSAQESSNSKSHQVQSQVYPI